MAWLRLGVLAALWVLLMGVGLFAAQNPELVTVRFLNAVSIQVPLGLVLVTFAGGGGVVWAVGATLPSRRSPQVFDPEPRDRVEKRPAAANPPVQDDWDEAMDDDWG
jgi:uncharacterized integral membrane protein